MRKNLYKVIKRKNRISCALSSKSKYSLKYLKSFETKAIPGTLGIFCFKRRKDAEGFVGWFGSSRMIVRVSPIGKSIKVNNMSNDITSKGLDQFYKNSSNAADKLTGTVCYPSVLVLE
jgi:hypothetical protein